MEALSHHDGTGYEGLHEWEWRVCNETWTKPAALNLHVMNNVNDARRGVECGRYSTNGMSHEHEDATRASARGLAHDEDASGVREH